MKVFAGFIKSTIAGGFFVLLPLLLLWVVFSQAFAVALKIAAPIAYLLSKNIFTDALRHKDLLAVMLLVGASFLCGAMLRVSSIRRVMRVAESHTLDRVPGYTVLRAVVSDSVRPESTVGFRPAMLLLSQGIQRPVCVIEDHGGGNFTVFLPAAPTAFSGMVHIAIAVALALIGAVAFVTVMFRLSCGTRRSQGPRPVQMIASVCSPSSLEARVPALSPSQGFGVAGRIARPGALSRLQ